MMTSPFTGRTRARLVALYLALASLALAAMLVGLRPAQSAPPEPVWEATDRLVNTLRQGSPEARRAAAEDLRDRLVEADRLLLALDELLAAQDLSTDAGVEVALLLLEALKSARMTAFMHRTSDGDTGRLTDLAQRLAWQPTASRKATQVQHILLPELLRYQGATSQQRDEILARLATSPDWQVRHLVALALMTAEVGVVHPLVAKLRADPHPEVRCAASHVPARPTPRPRAYPPCGP